MDAAPATLYPRHLALPLLLLLLLPDILLWGLIKPELHIRYLQVTPAIAGP